MRRAGLLPRVLFLRLCKNNAFLIKQKNVNTEEWLRAIAACGGHYEEIVVSEAIIDFAPVKIGAFSPMDEHWMNEALVQAEGALILGEVPVGAVVVQNGVVVGRGFNSSLSQSDPTAHAEVMALRDAARHLQNYRLPECELYVTLEPCAMCTGAIFQARLKRIIFGAFDFKSGVAGSTVNLFDNPQLNHHATIAGGLLEDKSVKLLRNFFKARRGKK